MKWTALSFAMGINTGSIMSVAVDGNTTGVPSMLFLASVAYTLVFAPKEGINVGQMDSELTAEEAE